MKSKKVAIILALQMLLTSWTLVGLVSASSTSPTTTISIQTPHNGSLGDGDSVYVSANPEFSLNSTLSGNGSITVTEYKLIGANQSSNITNYTSPVTIAVPHSSNLTIDYRSNSTTGLEPWKSLNLVVDADAPTIEVLTSGSAPLRYKSNQSTYVTSAVNPLTISCSDAISGVSNFSATIGSDQLNSTGNSIVLSNLPSAITSASSFTVDLSCSDNVNNTLNQSISVILDDSQPVLSVTEVGTRSGTCISGTWGLSVTTSDNHTSSYAERLVSNSWQQVSGTIGVASSFSGTITLRASDDAGLSSSNQNWTVSVDSIQPQIQASLNSTDLQINSSDSCGISSMQYRWETLNGQTYGWINSQNATISVPVALNGSIIRAQIKAEDNIGNTNYATTSWVNTNGSMPYSTVSILSDHVGSVISNESSFSINPVGYKSTANWTLSVNNQSQSNGSNSTQITLSRTFSHGDYVTISVNTSDGLGNYSVLTLNYTVDNSNSHQVGLTTSGTHLTTPSLILGPTGRLVPGSPSDDAGGVGPSHAYCSWDGTNWFRAQANSSYAPTGSPGSVQYFDFRCRSVDLLGNEGPITWLNGSVDLEAPTITLQPSSGNTIGPNSTISTNVSDDSGIQSSTLKLTWTNGTSTLYSNVSLGNANYSATLSQLFSGLGDGTVSADLIVVDSVGNIQYILGISWTLNTSTPSISVILSGDYSGQFISDDSTSFTLVPPSGGWTGLWMNYTMTDANGTSVFTGNISSSTTLNPGYAARPDLPEGNLWLNVTTGDSLGKVRTQVWNYTVDSSNSHQVNVTVSGTHLTTPSLILGPTGRLVLGNPSDDSGGVGPSHVSCSWDGANWFNAQASSTYAPTGSPGSVQNYTFGCRSVDLLGNEGPITWLNGSVDLQSPTITLQPSSGNTIGPNSTISTNLSDSNGIHSSTLRLTWTNGTSTLYSNASLGSSNYSATLTQLFSGLGDGTVSADLIVVDSVGNTQSILGTSWILNTSTPSISVILSGDYSGQFVTNDSTGFTLSLPSGGWSGLWVNYTMTDANGTSVFTGNISSSTTLNPGYAARPDLPEGNLWLNVTTGDSLGKVRTQVWNYTVDSSNSHQVNVTVSGTHLTTPSLILGPTGRLVPGSPSDDANGSGPSHVSCSRDGANWFNAQASSTYAPTGSPGSVQNYTFGCRSVDLLGNEGPITWLNGSVDLEAPTITLQPSSGNTIGPNSTISTNVSDDSGIQSSTLRLTWTNGTSTSYSNVSLGNTNYSATLTQLFSGLGDGTVSADLIVTDSVGNTQSILGTSWTLNTSVPSISVILSGDYSGQFVTNDSTGFTLSLPSGGWSGLWVNYTMTDANGTSVFSGNISSSKTLNPGYSAREDLPEGNLWLNVTTGDSFGKSRLQNWIYSVDSSNNQTPIISIIGSNLTASNVTWMGVNSQFLITGISDDSFGVGANVASCSWDQNNWFNVGSGSAITPITNTDVHENHTLSCKNLDILGNYGPLVQYSASTDRIAPSQSLSPNSASYIAPSSTLSVNTSDQLGVQFSMLNLTWTNGTNSWTKSVQIFNTTWTSSLGSIQTGLTDGTISIDLYTLDNLGNENRITGRVWYLNTSQPLSNITSSGQSYGQYILGGDGFSIHLTPPTIGGTNGWANYTLEHSNGTTLASGNTSGYKQISYGSQLENGQIWLNVTTFDMFMRNQSQIWTRFVDNSVGNLPNYSISGAAINQSGNPILGATGSFSITSIQDDVGGVGASHANCTWDNSNWSIANLSSVLVPPSTSGADVPFSLGCAVVDLLGNTGSIKWINGSVDLIKPAISYSISSGSLLSYNSSFNVTCTDSNGCSLSRISMFFNNGSNSFWNSITISGSSSGVSIASILNTTSSGTVTFYSISTDRLGNTKNQSSSAFQYLHDLPTLSTSISSENSGSYIDGNLTFTITPSSGWMTGINVTLLVEHSNSSSDLFSGSINQSLSQRTFNNLSEGQVWINTSICDILSRCSNSTVQLFVDNTAPTTPTFVISSGYQYQNQSRLLKGNDVIIVNEGIDSASDILRTICSDTDSQISFTNNRTSLSTQSFVQSEDWSTISCYSIDQVGNIGDTSQITIRRDDTSPSISITDQSQSGIIVPSKWYNSTCTDNVLIENQRLIITASGNTLYDTNSTESISIRYGTISALGPNRLISFELICTDEAGNQEINSRTLEWLPHLTASTITVSGLQQNGIFYVTDSATVTISNSRSDIYHEYRYIINGSGGNWIVENSTSFSLDLGDGNDSKNLRLELRVKMQGTSFSNTTYSNLMSVDLLGPSVSLVSNPVVSNGSLIDLSSSYSGVQISHYIWSWNNGSTIQSSSLSDVILPSSTDSRSWLSIRAYDDLGTAGDVLNFSITRDITPPVISLTNSHPGYLGPNSIITIQISESTGIAWSKIWINESGGQSTLVVANSSSYQLSSTDYPGWIWNYSSVSIVIETESNSGIFISESTDVKPDNISPTASISTASSTNLYGLNTSNNSQISITRSTDTSSLCAQIGANQSSASATNCLTETNNEIQFDRSSGNYVLLLNITDHAGNNNQLVVNLTHHTAVPTISSQIDSIVRPGDTQFYTTSSIFPTNVNLFWDGSSLQDLGGSFVTPAGNGSHTFTANITDALGLSFQKTWSLTLDGAAPTITLEGNIFGGNNIGSNTTLFLNSTDLYSDITSLRLVASSGNNSCSKLWNPQSLSFAVNSTLSNYFSASCTLLQPNQVSITVNITVEDNLGNSQQISRNLIHHGAINPPTWSFDLSIADSNFYWVSNLSTVGCNSSAGSYLPGIQLSWTGSGGVISGSEITEVTSSGVLTCTLSDAFGNVALSSLNLTYDNSNPSVSISLPSTSGTLNGTNYVQSGGDPFSISYGDNQTGISSTTYCISSSSNCASWQSISSTSIPLGTVNGSRILFVNITNGVGVSVIEDISYFQDDVYPTISLDAGSNTIIQNNLIYSGVNSPIIEISLSDDYCITNGKLSYDNGNFSIAKYSQTSIPLSATWLRIDTIDCVGHLTSANYSLTWISAIIPSNVTIAPNSTDSNYIQNNVVFTSGTGYLDLLTSHLVDLNLTCHSTSSPGGNLDAICEELQQNSFQLNFNSSSSNGYVYLNYTDQLGNSLNQSISFTLDNLSPSCQVQDMAIIESSDIYLSSSRDSSFVCQDNNTGIDTIYWLSQSGNKVFWSHNSASNYWSAPPPPSGTISLVAKDNVANSLIQTYNVIYDDFAPNLVISSDSSFSLDELTTRSNGSFDIDCVDLILGNCIVDIKIIDDVSGNIISSYQYSNSSTIELNLPAYVTRVRIDLSATDELDNVVSRNYILDIDNVAPALIVQSYSTITGNLLPNGIAANDSLLTISNLLQSDANLSEAGGVVLRCNDGSGISYSEPLRVNYDLSNYALDACSTLEFESTVTDSVGNTRQQSVFFVLDHKIPSVSFSSSDDCSWSAAESLDMQSMCGLEIMVDDDTHPDLVSSFQVQMTVIGSNTSSYYNLQNYGQFSMAQYIDQTVLVSVIGKDRVDRNVESNSFRVQVRDVMTPKWEGLVCAGGISCGWDNEIISSFSSQTIGVITFTNQAPIVNANFTFERSLSAPVYFENALFSSNTLPDGEYVLGVILEDAAGRIFEPPKIRFVYDNTAPILEIRDSIGIQNKDPANSTILSCDECYLSWVVNDDTNVTVSSSFGSPILVSKQFGSSIYSMPVAGFGNKSISITVIDQLGRSSNIQLQTSGLSSTILEPIVGVITENGVSIYCVESDILDFVRQINCLWTREGTTTSNIPIYVDIQVDRLYLRPVEIEIDKGSGGNPIPIGVTQSGNTSIPNIFTYNSEFTLSVVDEYSETIPIKYTIYKHSIPWEEVELVRHNLKESDQESTFDIYIEPSAEHGQFYLLDSYELPDLVSCSAEYRFAYKEKSSGTIEYYDTNSEYGDCEITDVEPLTNKSYQFEITLQNSEIRSNIDNPNFKSHPNPLFNLESLTLKLDYSDDLGMRLTEPLKINTASITRSPDILPVIDNNNELCPLSSNWDDKSGDRYLQSDNTMPLSNCDSDVIFDYDGINAIKWEITFDNSESSRVNVTCRNGEFFPENWDVASSANCESQGTPPSGTFDVKIEAYILDDRVYHNDGIEREYTEIQDEGQIIEIEMRNLKVFSIWEPKPEVENTRAHIEYAESNFNEIITTIFIIVIGTIAYFGFEIPRLRRKYGQIQKKSVSESSGNNDLNNTGDQPTKLTTQEQPKNSTNPTPDNNNSIQTKITDTIADSEANKRLMERLDHVPNRPEPPEGRPSNYSKQQWDWHGGKYMQSRANSSDGNDTWLKEQLQKDVNLRKDEEPE